MTGRILVVEDAEAFREMAGRILERAGYTADFAATAAMAETRAQENAYVVVISDWGLADGTAEVFLRALRNSEHWATNRSVPVIITSAMAATLDLTGLEPVTEMPKPFTATQLLKSIDALLRPHA